MALVLTAAYDFAPDVELYAYSASQEVIASKVMHLKADDIECTWYNAPDSWMGAPAEGPQRKGVAMHLMWDEDTE